MTGKVFNTSSNIYQDQAKILLIIINPPQKP